MLRGPSYLRDSVKVSSEISLFKLVAIDFFKMPQHKDRLNVASRPDNWVAQMNERARAHPEQGPAPYTFILNILIPSQAPGLMSMMIYFQARNPADLQSNLPEAKLLRDFIAGDDAYRYSRFKLLARTRGSPFLRRLMGVKPVLLGTKL